MKKYLKYLMLFVLLIAFSVPNTVFATSYSGDYIIEKYDIDMVVNENNTFDITETITAYFNAEKHGIYRKIPLKNSIIRSDGSKSSNAAKVSNISVSENYTISKENGYEVIKIGSDTQTYKGAHTYIINYTYDIGKDPLKGADELYFNLVGSGWDTSINNVTFKITMPKSFDESLLGFTSGSVDSTSSSDISYSVDGNVISGILQKELYSEQALTVRLELPEGYFVGENLNIDIYSIVISIICLICVLITVRLWSKYGKDDDVVETVEFYPPEGYNSAEVGFLYKGSADLEGIISLLIYLADKGYLKIEETENVGVFNKSKGFKITKLKEYDGNNECEKLFFEGLFKEKSDEADPRKAIEIMKEEKNNGEKISFDDALTMTKISNTSKTSVTESDLKNNFYSTLNLIKSKLESRKNKRKIFETVSTGIEKWLVLMIIGIYILITIKPVLEYGEASHFLDAFIFPIIGIIILIDALLTIRNKSKESSFITSLILIGIPWASVVFPALTQNRMYIIMYIIGIICMAIIMIFFVIIPKRTQYGNEILGKLRGFKRFLETAEKSQLESLVEQNPDYFYNILPYTYALGVSDVWIKQFEKISLKSPSWCDSTYDFNIKTFGKFMITTMASASIAMSSNPSSGGGRAGRGSGGGGGGSW